MVRSGVTQGDRADSPVAGARPVGCHSTLHWPTQHHQLPRCTGGYRHPPPPKTSHTATGPPSPTAKRHWADQFGVSAGCPGQGIAPGRHALPGQPSARAGKIGRCTAGGGGTCRPKACHPVAARSPAHQSATDLTVPWRRPAPTSRSRHEDVTRHVGMRWPEEPARTSVSAVTS